MAPDLHSNSVVNSSLFLCSELGGCVTVEILYVNDRLNVIDMVLNSRTMNTGDETHLSDISNKYSCIDHFNYIKSINSINRIDCIVIESERR